MKTSKFKKLLSAAGVMLAMGIGSPASAAPIFTVDPTVLVPFLNSTPDPFLASFTADQISGSSTELLHATSATTLAGSGWLKIDAYTNGPDSVSGLITGINVSPFGYQLYIDFFLVSTLISGALGQPGSAYVVNTLSYAMYVDPNGSINPLRNQFTLANALTTTEASSGTVLQKSDDILLGVGEVVLGVAGINNLGGAFLNSIQTFGVCNGVGTASFGGIVGPAPGCTSALGSQYFAAPVPFYSIAFDEFNNVQSGVLFNPVTGDVSIADATGKITFAAVPEPGSLALLALGLLGLGFSFRRRNA